MIGNWEAECYPWEFPYSLKSNLVITNEQVKRNYLLYETTDCSERPISDLEWVEVYTIGKRYENTNIFDYDIEVKQCTEKKENDLNLCENLNSGGKSFEIVSILNKKQSFVGSGDSGKDCLSKENRCKIIDILHIFHKIE
ncbi:MAG: hypothetical protein AB8G05_15745 [Oligoflexales bacterium]